MAGSAEYQKLRMIKESYAAQLAKKTWEARDRKLAAVAEMDADEPLVHDNGAGPAFAHVVNGLRILTIPSGTRMVMP